MTMIKENNLSIIKSIVKKYSLGHALIIEVNKDGALNLIIMVKLMGDTPLYYLELMRQEIEQVIKLSVYIFIYGFPVIPDNFLIDSKVRRLSWI